jgi:hypothetical protein
MSLGWTPDSELLILKDAGQCDSSAAGIYAFRPGRPLRLIAALPSPEPSDDNYEPSRWTSAT